ncbi:hypothetical protein [Aliiruegeria sabulilitoris]|uniref:hypothetical protein n=1 Tax=Aliiruegeria sabulilitoris TaxID=1510458 RepID=UPI00082F693E|nr:hypothetical protein [Aliiruegeria sabulilitoris]NDR56108.1 hypothetical protein [Pseudoruegeria sp. M32A2M]
MRSRDILVSSDGSASAGSALRHVSPPLEDGRHATGLAAREQSKFPEDFLGGVTARVVKDTRIPVPLSY